MKATNAIRPGTEPDFGLQTKYNGCRPAAGPLQGGWDQFYASSKSDGFRPHLHTYGADSEKFFETFKLPYQPGRPPKPPPRPIGVPGQTWGVGGTLPCGTRRPLYSGARSTWQTCGSTSTTSADRWRAGAC